MVAIDSWDSLKKLSGPDTIAEGKVAERQFSKRFLMTPLDSMSRLLNGDTFG